MDWSSNINNLFSNYKANMNKDFNGDGKVDSKDKEKLFEKTGFINSSELNYDDLIQLSLKKDVNNDGSIADDEKSFFNDVKNFIYEKIAQNINRDNDLSLDEMLDLEKKVRNLSETQKEDVGKELERVQNRMVSNITSQFFVNTETQSYKDAAIDNALKIWNTQDKLTEMNSNENNPFNAKMETLLNKLDKKVNKTLSEKYSVEQIKELKETGKISTTSSTEDSSTIVVRTIETEEIDGHKYESKEHKDGKIYQYKDGELLTGVFKNKYYKDGLPATGNYENKYYEYGEIVEGVGAVDGNYYSSGTPASGTFTYLDGTVYVENGKIIYQDKVNSSGDTERTVFIAFKHKDENNNIVESTFSKIITFDGSNTDKMKSAINYENGQKVSTETYVYNEAEETYTVTIKYVDTTKQDKTEIRDKDDNVYKEDGLCFFKGRLYNNGQLSTGFTEFKGKYYMNSYPAQGVYKNNGVLKYYDNGLILEIKPSLLDLIEKAGIIGAVVKTDDDGTTIKGKSIVNGNITDVEYHDFTFDSNNEITGFIRSAKLSNDVLQNDTFTKSGNAIFLTAATVTLKGSEDKVINLELDNAKNQDAIDYATLFYSIDGEQKGVLIAQAYNDNITIMTLYEKDENGKYVEAGQKFAMASIMDIENGKPYDSFEMSQIIKNGNGTFSIKDENSENYGYELVYGIDGKFIQGKITFKKSGQEINLSAEDKFYINNESIVVVSSSDNRIKYYDLDGFEKKESLVITNELKSLVQQLGINLTSVDDFEIDNNGNIKTITIRGITLNVSVADNTITLSNLEKNYEIVYEKISENSSQYAMISQKAPIENGYQIRKWNIDGKRISDEIFDNSGQLVTQYLYDNDIKEV